MTTTGLISLARPKHYIKNLFIFAPLVFAGLLDNPEKVASALLAFAAFCLAASSIYCINDIIDQKRDALHPTKSKERPLCNGSVTLKSAAILTMVLLVSLTSIVFFLNTWSQALIITYIITNIFYSFRLKHIPVVDICVIASFFVIRVYLGAAAISVPLSNWMLITTFCLSLFLAVIKRRQELLSSSAETRRVLAHYSVTLMDQYALITATCCIVFYGLFAITIRQELSLTIPLVIFGLLRYWFIVSSTGEGESPTNLLYKDRQIQVVVVAWIVACIVLVGGHQ